MQVFDKFEQASEELEEFEDLTEFVAVKIFEILIELDFSSTGRISKCFRESLLTDFGDFPDRPMKIRKMNTIKRFRIFTKFSNDNNSKKI